jgi:hypothetical protein
MGDHESESGLSVTKKNVSVQAMKACGGSEGKGPHAISARGKGVFSDSLPGHFNLGRRDALRIAYDAGWPASVWT